MQAIGGEKLLALFAILMVIVGFLIVPSLMYSTGMPIFTAVGSSLVRVTAFGLTTAVNYGLDGWVDWIRAPVCIGGGVLGGLVERVSPRACPPARTY